MDRAEEPRNCTGRVERNGRTRVPARAVWSSSRGSTGRVAKFGRLAWAVRLRLMHTGCYTARVTTPNADPLQLAWARVMACTE